MDSGKILYANLILQGKENDLYIFKTKDGYEHFDSTGKSIKKSLMKLLVTLILWFIDSPI